MNKYAHPMQGLNGGMGWALLDDIQEWGQSKIDDIVEPITSGAEGLLEDAGFSKEEIDQMKKDASSSVQSQIDSEKDRLAKELAQQIVGSGGQTATTSPPIDIQAEIDKINKNPIVASIPGGIYTIGGLGLGLLLYIALRR